MKLHYFTTAEVKDIGAQIFQIKLQPKAQEVFSFTAGQYLQLVMADGKIIPLSIASPAWQKDYLELHLKVMEGHPLAREMLDHFKQNETIVVQGPFGNCILSEENCPAILIAGGTGLSPMKSIVETALKNDAERPIHLYFGAQKRDELYQDELLNQLAKSHAHFTYVPVLAAGDENWRGDTGFPHQIALRDLADKVRDAEFYVSGSPAMVLAVYKDLLAAGASKESIHSDILDMKRDAGEID